MFCFSKKSIKITEFFISMAPFQAAFQFTFYAEAIRFQLTEAWRAVSFTLFSYHSFSYPFSYLFDFQNPDPTSAGKTALFLTFF